MSTFLFKNKGCSANNTLVTSLESGEFIRSFS